MKTTASHSGAAVDPARRRFLSRTGTGLGSVALQWLLQRDLRAASLSGTLPASMVTPQLPARAKNVIFLFMEGGPSHLDLLDPKPLLNALAGKEIPPSFRPVITSMGEFRSPILGSKRTWSQHGQGGLWFSDWLPHLATCADDISVIRSCYGDGINHSSGICQMNTGSILAGRPSLGSWVSYGLGTLNQSLPAFVVMQDAPAQVVNGSRNWGAGFMPAVHQGVRMQIDSEPIPNLGTPEGLTEAQQRAKIDLLGGLNRQFAGQHPEQSELEARIAGYELAFRMQSEAPQAVDLSGETPATQALYGIGGRETGTFGRMCLMARRLVEKGVRFVQLYHGAGNRWDAHEKIEKNHSELCRSMDLPVAGLLKDLKARGLLDETLVIWGGEFGRTPMSEKGDGRDHNPSGFSLWMAGGGVAGGRTLGTTDALGLHAEEDRLHVHDLHATILWLLGLDNMGLTYRYKGRPERPTQNEGEPFRRIVG